MVVGCVSAKGADGAPWHIGHHHAEAGEVGGAVGIWVLEGFTLRIGGVAETILGRRLQDQHEQDAGKEREKTHPLEHRRREERRRRRSSTGTTGEELPN